MRIAASIISTFLQLLYVAGLFDLFYTLIVVLGGIAAGEFSDPKLAAGEISQATMTLIFLAIFGLVGAALAWYALRDKEKCPAWFISVSKLFAFAWLVFVPVGTIVGFFMFRWRKADSESFAAA